MGMDGMVGERYEKRTRIKVLKVRAGDVFEVVGRRSEPLGYVSHWLGRENYMCAGTGCPACRAALGGRWVGALPVALVHGAELRGPFLLELTGPAWARTDGLLRLEGVGGAVGVCFRVARRRARSGLLVDPFAEEVLAGVKSLADWVLLDALATLFHLPRCLEGESAKEWSERASLPARCRLEAAIARLPIERQ